KERVVMIPASLKGPESRQVIVPPWSSATMALLKLEHGAARVHAMPLPVEARKVIGAALSGAAGNTTANTIPEAARNIVADFMAAPFGKACANWRTACAASSETIAPTSGKPRALAP